MGLVPPKHPSGYDLHRNMHHVGYIDGYGYPRVDREDMSELAPHAPVGNYDVLLFVFGFQTSQMGQDSAHPQQLCICIITSETEHTLRQCIQHTHIL